MKKSSRVLLVFLCSIAMQSSVLGAPWDASVVEQVQLRLNEAGFDCGVPDGVSGSRTTEAIRAFQEYMGLPADGEISEELLDILGVGFQWEEETDIQEESWYDSMEESELYYTYGEELLLMDYGPLQVKLKGDQSNAFFAGDLVGLEVEAINNSELYFDIYYTMNIPAYSESEGSESNYLFDSMITPYSAQEGIIYGYSKEMVTSIEDITTVQIFFSVNVYSEETGEYDYWETMPIIVCFPGESETSESGISEGEVEDGAVKEAITVSLFNDIKEHEGKWISLSQKGMFSPELEVCVPKDWNYSTVKLDGMAVGEFISSEQIKEMQELLNTHIGEPYERVLEGVSPVFVEEDEAISILSEIAASAGSVLVTETNGISVVEINKELLAEKASEYAETEFFKFVNNRQIGVEEAVFLIMDNNTDGKTVIFVNRADPRAEEVFSSMRIFIEESELEDYAMDSYTVITDPSEIPEIPEEVLTWCGGLPDTFAEVETIMKNLDGFDLEPLIAGLGTSEFKHMTETLQSAGNIEIPEKLKNISQEWSGNLQYLVNEYDEMAEYMELIWNPEKGILEMSAPVNLEQVSFYSFGIFCCPCDNPLSINYNSADDMFSIDKQYYMFGAEGEFYQYSVYYYGNENYWVDIWKSEEDRSENWSRYYGSDGTAEDISYTVY